MRAPSHTSLQARACYRQETPKHGALSVTTTCQRHNGPPSRRNSMTIFGTRSFLRHRYCTRRKHRQQRHIIALHKARLVFALPGTGTAVIMPPPFRVRVVQQQPSNCRSSLNQSLLRLLWKRGHSLLRSGPTELPCAESTIVRGTLPSEKAEGNKDAEGQKE
jgi:hypothetical protein